MAHLLPCKMGYGCAFFPKVIRRTGVYGCPIPEASFSDALGTRGSPDVPLLTLDSRPWAGADAHWGPGPGSLPGSAHSWPITDRWRAVRSLINVSFQNVPFPNKSPSSDQHSGRPGIGWLWYQMLLASEYLLAASLPSADPRATPSTPSQPS